MAYPTEFSNHAKAVQLFSEKPGFDLEGYRQAALLAPDSEVVARLMSVRDFARGYENTQQLSEELLQAKILLKVEEFGTGGISENEWHEFGPVTKTMTEFKEAYDRFLERCVRLASGSR